MKQYRETLDTLSGQFFMVGFFSTRLKAIPIFFFKSILNLVALAAYFIGYIIWFVATLCYPDHKRKDENWYGFAQFKEQFQVAALVGTLATLLCIIAPEFIIPAAWAYAVSNLFWSIGEYHKKENPPNDGKYSSAKQALYLQYSMWVTCSSVVTALATTSAFLFPLAAPAIITVSSILGIGLIIPAAYFWNQSYFGTFEPDPIVHSFTQLNPDLLTVKTTNEEPTVADEPHFPPLFSQARNKTRESVSPVALSSTQIEHQNGISCNI